MAISNLFRGLQKKMIVLVRTHAIKKTDVFFPLPKFKFRLSQVSIYVLYFMDIIVASQKIAL